MKGAKTSVTSHMGCTVGLGILLHELRPRRGALKLDVDPEKKMRQKIGYPIGQDPGVYPRKDGGGNRKATQRLCEY